MKIGLALGGGGARGLAHVPALEVIDEMGIKPVVIAGTSMGAIIGALYASGQSGKEIRENVNKLLVTKDDSLKDLYHRRHELVKWLKAVKPSWSKSGFLKADGFLGYLLEAIAVDTFEELEIPFKAMTADFYNGKPVVFDSGELLPAITASMSIPGVFVPVEHGGKVLVDGGVVDNLPYDIIKDECDATIAIDVAPTREAESSKAPELIDASLGMFDILVDRVTEFMVKEHPPTVYIRPKLTDVRVLDFDKIRTVYEQSKPAMDELREKLKEIL